MASLPQKPAQLPSDGVALFATSRVEGDCQNISCRALKSCLLANCISLPNFDLIVIRVAASSGPLLPAGAAAATPMERAVAVRAARSVLYMQELPSRFNGRSSGVRRRDDTCRVARLPARDPHTSIGRNVIR